MSDNKNKVDDIPQDFEERITQALYKIIKNQDRVADSVIENHMMIQTIVDFLNQEGLLEDYVEFEKQKREIEESKGKCSPSA